MKPIKLNKIRCNSCGDEPVSTHVHDYRPCKCGRVVVDGGNEYLKRAWEPGFTYTELSEFEEYHVSR